jgi:catechol 2,3-dioxygenase-like lactoylglutathione lyase family enzyme
MAIQGLHAMFYSSEADELRTFFRDKLGLPATDIDLPEADLGCHPVDPTHGPPSGTADISFYTADIEQTVAELKSHGVELTAPIADHGYGLVTYVIAPGGLNIQIYQPKFVK